MLLEVEHLSKRFAGLAAVNDVSFSVAEGEILAMIGPNGAGKTTLINAITNVTVPSEGRISFRGESISNLPSHAIARKGLVRTFQNLRLFRSLSVLENVMSGHVTHMEGSLLDAVVASGRYRRDSETTLRSASKILAMLDLEGEANRLAGDLPYGRRRMVEIGRALCAQPKLLCLDEPAAGLNREEAQALGGLIRRLRASGLTLLVIEHNMQLVMELADRVLVLDHGERIALDTPEAIARDEKVIQAYLGVRD